MAVILIVLQAIHMNIVKDLMLNELPKVSHRMRIKLGMNKDKIQKFAAVGLLGTLVVIFIIKNAYSIFGITLQAMVTAIHPRCENIIVSPSSILM